MHGLLSHLPNMSFEESHNVTAHRKRAVSTLDGGKLYARKIHSSLGNHKSLSDWPASVMAA